MKNIYLMLAVFFGTFIWSIINPKEGFTYFLILIHCIILFVGGHYTYAEVPLFDYIKEIFGQSRNNYDKVGHFAQGLVPAMIIRELFIRKKVISNESFFNFIIVSICLAISAAYEWIEWGVSLATGDGGDAFLGTQGDVWDTQSDMLFATIGAIVGLILFSKIQDKQIRKI